MEGPWDVNPIHTHSIYRIHTGYQNAVWSMEATPYAKFYLRDTAQPYLCVVISYNCHIPDAEV